MTEDIATPINPEKVGTDRSLQSPNKFVVEISKFPQLSIYAQTINIPSVGLPTTKVPTSSPEDYFIPGDKLDWGLWMITIPLAKNFEAYITMLNWIKELPEGKDKNPLSNMSVLLLTNNQNLNKTLTLYFAHPYTISEAKFDTKVDGDTIITVDITFRYAYFTIT